MLRNGVFLLLVVCGTACRHSPEKVSWTVHPAGRQISFPLPPKVSPFTTCLRYCKGNLYFYDSWSSDILVFSLQHKQLVKTIRIPQDPPDRIGRIAGFSVWSDDTLVVKPNDESRLVLIDAKGKPLHNISLDMDGMSRQQVILEDILPRSFDGIDIYRDGSLAVIIQNPYTLMHLPVKVEPEDLTRFRMFYLYDLGTGQGRFSTFGLPKNYFSKGRVRVGFSVIRMADRYVYACKLDSDLFWTSDFETFHTVPQVSRYIPERIPTYNPADPDPYAYLAGTSEYKGFYYDPWRKVAYRTGRLAVSPELLQQADYDYKQVVLYSPDWILQVFSQELRMLCEERFAGHFYSPHNAFVAPEGLYISISNPMREDYTEDSLRFELFELVQQ